ncbi:hypothetical protein BH09BAC1_BH09BAC1_10270 [soil metagenome]
MRYLFLLIITTAVCLTSCKKDDDDSPGGNNMATKDEAFTDYFRRTDNGWVAGDGGTSIPLSDGRVLWLWGDSHIGNYEAATQTVPCLFQVNNAGLVNSISNPGQMTTLIGTGSPASLYEHPGSWPEFLFWPGAGYQLGDTIYAFLNNIATTGTGLGFTSGGADYVAKMTFPGLAVAGFEQLPAHNGIDFRIGFIDGGNGYKYAYGSKGDGFLGTKAYLARIKANDPVNTWEYHTGSGWSANAAQASVIAEEGVSAISSAFKYEDKYVLLSTHFSLGCDGKNIYAFTADKPEGPFTGPITIYEIPDTMGGA